MGLEVSNRGEVRRSYLKSSRFGVSATTNPLSRKTDADGNVFVEIRSPHHESFRVDEIVAKCFYRDVPKTSPRQTFLIHKDGNKSNCASWNLKWATSYEHGLFYAKDPAVNTSDGFRLVKDNLYVSQDGEVKQDGMAQTVCDSFFDPDMDREAAVRPYVRNNATNKREYIEDLVAAAYLPEPAGMNHPDLLHIDNDYRNCSLDNLKWVEQDSDEYRAYLIKKDEDIKKRMEELNPHLASI